MVLIRYLNIRYYALDLKIEELFIIDVKSIFNGDVLDLWKMNIIKF